MNSSTPGTKLIFVGGAPRSGTTLVQNILDSHPQICGGPEFLHLPEIVRFRRGIQNSLKNGWLNYYTNPRHADELIRQMIMGFLCSGNNGKNTVYFSEKTPGNVLIFTDLMELFQDARFIGIWRDPRSTIASMLKVGKRAKSENVNTQEFTYNIHAAVNFLKNCYLAAEKASHRSPGAILNIRYEDLITEPKREVQKICEFLNIDWSENMLSPEKNTHPGENDIANEVWYTQKEYKRKIDSSNLHTWRKELNFLQKAIILSAFYNYTPLQRMGYNFSSNLCEKIRSYIYIPIGKAAVLSHKLASPVRRWYFKLKLKFAKPVSG